MIRLHARRDPRHPALVDARRTLATASSTR
jgi:hypothetical protein